MKCFATCMDCAVLKKGISIAPPCVCFAVHWANRFTLQSKMLGRSITNKGQQVKEFVKSVQRNFKHGTCVNNSSEIFFVAQAVRYPSADHGKGVHADGSVASSLVMRSFGVIPSVPDGEYRAEHVEQVGDLLLAGSEECRNCAKSIQPMHALNECAYIQQHLIMTADFLARGGSKLRMEAMECSDFPQAALLLAHTCMQWLDDAELGSNIASVSSSNIMCTNASTLVLSGSLRGLDFQWAVEHCGQRA